MGLIGNHVYYMAIDFHSQMVPPDGLSMRINQFFMANRWFDSAILLVVVMAFAGATYNHAADLMRGGLFPYAKWYGAPESFNLYWTGLTLLDPLAIAALIINVRVGYVLALCIMLTDVPINLYANANYWSLPFHENDALIMQIGFLLFLLLTIRRVWRLSGANHSETIIRFGK